jgi:hypothetical protein
LKRQEEVFPSEKLEQLRYNEAAVYALIPFP